MKEEDEGAAPTVIVNCRINGIIFVHQDHPLWSKKYKNTIITKHKSNQLQNLSKIKPTNYANNQLTQSAK